MFDDTAKASTAYFVGTDPLAYHIISARLA